MKEKDLSMKVSLILYQKNQSNNTQASLWGTSKSPKKSNDPQKRLPGKTWKPFFPLKHQYIIKYILKY